MVGKCPKCGGAYISRPTVSSQGTVAPEEIRCLNCGFIKYNVSVEAQAEFDRSVGKLKVQHGKYDRRD